MDKAPNLTRSIPTDAPDDAAVERVAQALLRTDLVESECEAQRLIKGGGVRVNGQVIDEDALLVIGAGTISAGTKRHAALTASIPPTTAPEATVSPGDTPPSLNAPTFEYRDEERVCINGCLYLRADFAAQSFRKSALTTTAQGEVVQADRERAWDFAEKYGPFTEADREAFMSGRYDGMHFVRTFRDHRLAFSHPSCEVERLREALRSARDCITYLGFGRPTDLTSVLSKIDAALSTPETVSLKGDRV